MANEKPYSFLHDKWSLKDQLKIRRLVSPYHFTRHALGPASCNIRFRFFVSFSEKRTYVDEALERGDVRVLAVYDRGDDVTPLHLLGAEVGRHRRQRRRLVAPLIQRAQSRRRRANAQSSHDFLLLDQLRQQSDRTAG